MLENVRRSWPVIQPVLIQMGLAAGIALLVSLAIGHTWPIFAPIFAVAALEMICSRHHRTAVTLAFGMVLGVLLGGSFNPAWPAGHAFTDAVIGGAAALAVAVFTTPANPVAEVHRAIDPLLGLVSAQIRNIATALRTGDVTAARTALHALNASADELRKLDETLVQVRRSAILARWRSGQDVPAATTTATEIGHAVRSIRAMALQAWWGVLRGGESVPAALPQMLDALADGIAVLRGDIGRGNQLRQARRLLISSAQWITVMRTEPLGIAAAAVAANADAAVINLLIATGLSVEQAEASIQQTG
ncbi:MAG TPA: hypothetical protein VFE14_10320 [Micromonosporaceae bacterium]|nr:hypothetical protein [Micromonosporaceae bacterium]